MNAHITFIFLQLTAVMVLAYGVKQKMYRYNITGFLFILLVVILGAIKRTCGLEAQEIMQNILNIILILFCVGLSVYKTHSRISKNRRLGDKVR